MNQLLIVSDSSTAELTQQLANYYFAPSDCLHNLFDDHIQKMIALNHFECFTDFHHKIRQIEDGLVRLIIRHSHVEL